MIAPSTDILSTPRADRLPGLWGRATVVLFAGLGGACIGIEDAYVLGGYRDKFVDLCVNHWDVAVRVHELNHPMTQHLHADVWEVDPDQVLPGREIAYLHASPDCTDFSKAKGGMPKRKHIRALADVVLVWADKRRPDVITLENVEEFLDWGPLVHKRSGRRWAWVRRRAGTDRPATTIPGPRMDAPEAGAWIADWESTGWSVEPWLMPDPDQRGKEYRRWKAGLEALGYVVKAKEIRPCHHATPTTRNRLFVIARCDGGEIVWPEATHGSAKTEVRDVSSKAVARDRASHGRPGFRQGQGASGRVLQGIPCDERRAAGAAGSLPSDGGREQRRLKPYNSAWSCVDPTQPMLSIFATRAEARRWAKAVNKTRPKHDRVGIPQRPLRPMTQNRLAGGLLKWVLDASKPFVVTIENYGWNSSSCGRPADEPLSTVTGYPKGGKHAAVDVELAGGYVGTLNHGGAGHRTADVREPLSTVTGARDARGLVGVSFTAGVGGRAGQSPATSIDAPMPTVTGKGDRVVAAVHLTTYHGKKGDEVRGLSPDQPVTTLDTQNRYGLVAAEVAPFSIGAGGPAYSGKPKSVDVPFNTVTSDDRKSLVAVALNKHYTGVVGQGAGEPLGTVTGVDHNSILAAHLVKFRGSSLGTAADQPVPTITSGQGAKRDAGAAHALGVAAAHLVKFRGQSPGTGAGDPVDTITADGHGMGAAVAYLSHMYTSNTCGGEGDPSKPAKTITSGGQHGAVSVVYLAAYYGEGSGKTGHTPGEPMPTVVGQDRFAAVSVESTPHWVFTAKALKRAKQVATWAKRLLGKKVQKHLMWVTDEAGKRFALLVLALEGAIHVVTDIAMRMLRPRELARAQGFPDDYVIDRTVDGQWVSKADQVKLIGNSVCRQVMAAIACANVVDMGVLDEAREAVSA